ncbi:MAG: SpoIIE family protein phosphatase [Desulfobacterales bacterium]|jgi:serine phosphatase RsbU (regulator of sigma subunit)|nr:SpoIIE family protein phosphatase [Desulfobacterales bacterium]
MSNRVLLVDDDPNILAAFKRQLRKKADIETAASGAAGLEILKGGGPFAVVVTDYCMPEMNGIEFLAQVRRVSPDSVRMMLTGSADLAAAIQAVNQGNIFRFLTKPCASEELLEVLKAGIEEYRRIHRERKFNKRTRRWLKQAMEVQQCLLPGKSSGWQELDIAGRSVFCDQTGGDYYDYFEKSETGEPTISVVVGDVSDHGLPSALLMTTARATLRECASRPASPRQIVSHINRRLAQDVQDTGRFMTLFYAEIERATRSIRWVRAGHDPAITYDPRAGQFAELNGQSGLPLGVFDEAVYEEHRRELGPEQIVALATDGIWEARSAEGRVFGKKRMQEVIREHAARPAAEIVEQTLEELQRFLHPGQVQDDATLVVVKVGG